MLDKKAPKLPRPNAYPTSEILYAALIESALRNQPERTRDNRGCAQPRRRALRSFRATSPARPISSRLGRSRTREPNEVLRPCKGHRANGAAVDPRGGGTDEESTIEALIATIQCLPPNGRVLLSVVLRPLRRRRSSFGGWGRERGPEEFPGVPKVHTTRPAACGIVRRTLFGSQRAISPRSPLRIRTASSMEETKILPSPILPELAAALNTPTISAARESGTKISIFTLGRRSTLYSAPRYVSV